MDNKRLIRIFGKEVFLTPDVSLPLSQTSLLGTHLSFSSYQDIYFEVEVSNDTEANKIIVDVLNYAPTNINKFREQVATRKVDYITFKPLKWNRIEKHLFSYTRSVLFQKRIVVYGDDDKPSDYEKKETQRSSYKDRIEERRSPAYPVMSGYLKTFPAEPTIEKVVEDAEVSFDSVNFYNGYASVRYRSKKLKDTFSLKIANDFLLKEFNSIKSYFPKALGKKRCSITINFTLIKSKVTDIVSISKDIDSINQNVIDSIKYNRILKLTSTPITQQQSIYTAEDVFENFGDTDSDCNVFNQSEQDILDALIKLKDVRNAKHLQYLSGTKHCLKERIRFTLKPLFGFIFFVEGKIKNHFCWELLNSHATYIWSFDRIDKSIDEQYRKVEETINIIKEIGRETYKRKYKEGVVDADITFQTLEHSKINSTSDTGYSIWLHNLDNKTA